MASCITSQFGNSYCPQARLTVSQGNETNTTIVLSWQLEYVTHGYTASTNGNGRTWSVTIDGSTVDSGTTDINGKSTYTVASGSKTVSKQSARSVNFGLSFEFDFSWGSATGSNEYGGTKTTSDSIDIPAATYIVYYMPNGGTGTMEPSYPTYGIGFKTRQNTFTRDGYSFNGWNESADGTGTVWALNAAGTYESGQPWTWTYTKDINLYAQWKANTYVISYDAQGGTGAPANQTKVHDTPLTLSSTIPTKTGYNFKGWGTYPNTTEVVYTAGGSYTNNQEHVLYAVWEPNKYSITFDANGGTGAPAKIEYSYSPSGSFVLTSTKPTRTGYTFLGWSLDKNATEPEYYAGQTNWGYFNADAYVLYAVWRQNVLTVHYNSNYATEAFSGALSQVGEDKDVIVRTETFLYDTPYEYGLTNYTETNNNTYLARKGYTAAGYWATVNEIDVDWRSKLNGEPFNFIRYSDDIAIWQDYTGFTGQDLAHILGVALGDGDKTVNLYAQWYIKASRVTIYNDNNEPEDGLICIYTKDGSVRYGTITVYDANGNPRTVI